MFFVGDKVSGTFNPGVSLVAQWLSICLLVQETQVQSLGQEDPLVEEMATHCSILAWEIPGTEEPGGLQSMRFPSQICFKMEYACILCKIPLY